MPIRLKQVRKLSVGATSDYITVNLTDDLDGAESVSSGTVNGFIVGSSTGITFGAVSATTGTYIERDTMATVAAGAAMRFSVSATTSVSKGMRVIEVSFSTSARGPLTRELAFEVV